MQEVKNIIAHVIAMHYTKSVDFMTEQIIEALEKNGFIIDKADLR